MLEKKQAELRRKKEEQEQKGKKEQLMREKLKKKILEDVAQKKEEKHSQNIDINQNQNLNHTQVEDEKILKVKQRKEKELIELLQKGKIKKQDVSQQIVEKLEEIEKEKENDKLENQKLKKLFRSRYASYLSSLQLEKSKKLNEQQEKQKKEEQMKQLSKQNYNNITSKLYQDTKSSKQKDLTNTEENPEEKESQLKEAQKKLLEKQKQYLQQIKDKNLSKKEQEELEQQRKQQLMFKMRDFVLVQVKKDIENGDFYVEDPKEARKNKQKKKNQNLQALDLQTVDKSKITKEKADKICNSEQEDDEDQLENDKKKRKLRSYPFITDFDQWKKKQRLDPNQKIFIISGGYPVLKKALKARGWMQNPDFDSCCFDLKWTMQKSDIDFNGQQDFQMVNHFEKNSCITTKIGIWVNHFEKNSCITTKIGICKNLKNLIWFANIDIDQFYPRCFDLNDPEDYENFLEDFKTTKAESILKTYMRMYKDKDQTLDEILEQAKVALLVCQRKIRDLDDIIDDQNPHCLINQKEWEILSKDELKSETLAVKKHQAWLEKIGQSNAQKPKKQKQKKTKKLKKNINDQDTKIGEEKLNQEQQQQQEIKQNLEQENQEQEQEDEDVDEEYDIQKMDEFTKQVYDILQQLKQQYPQFGINGENNIWILKPARMSRGRGITCFNSLIEIQDHVKAKEQQWVIQKYIENPLIIMKRKFDIRVWVLVTNLNPLTVWIYQEFYVRFSAVDYSKEATDLSNKFLHLCNNSISAKNKGCDQIVGHGNMWYQKDLKNYLLEQEGEDIFSDKIYPNIKQAIIHTLECVQDQMEGKKNSIELFGYDFMLDDQYNSWLLECNSSPAMDYSTEVTEKLVKQQLEDTIKVLVDYREAKKKKGVDTGLWKKVYKGQVYQDKNTNNQGLNLCLEGVQIKKNGNKLPKIK
ncbi:hypothetical protein PPERSA_05719 [Pseudocohnilembus persalinus]|uniref:Tubulin-tyrosine ligase family n=1 Tax=Pseudocohnilembus persalinus TaxID=266149 RepID=A0A0V0QIG2_PSEPJ|nr:hypothetical protein PPERSA_05719 [Pseudocohnilembus persalinus]|eukprot:KRX01880.1 hypothetical protein PPERSA_05719 [Pseudocohnilembus persalinus]